MSKIEIIKADLKLKEHQKAVLELMDAYAQDPMGDAQPLSAYAKKNLIKGLQDHPTTLVFLAFKSSDAYGIATCFRGFSTFRAKPLINLSDFYVNPDLRGFGVGRLLLKAIEKEAISSGCCKITLEVQENNKVAQTIYSNFGFSQAVYPADADGGGSLYMVKDLP